MKNHSNRITISLDHCGGRPCIRGMRIRVVDILDLLASGLTQRDILVEFPNLENEDVEAAINYVRAKLN